MREKDIKIEQNMNVVDKILNTVKTGNLRLNAPELASLVFLKFTSDNAEMLCVEIDSFHSYNALVSLLSSGAISVREFIDSCAKIIDQTGMNRYGVGPYLAQFLMPLATNRAMIEVLNLVAKMDLTDDRAVGVAAQIMSIIISKLRVTARDEYNTSSDSIAQLMAGIAVSENCKSVYDGACGYGLGLMHAHILAPNATVEGQDININCVMVCAIMQWLAFNSTFTIELGDTLRSPLSAKRKQKYDAVIMAPPFGLRIDDDVILSATEETVKYGDLLQRKSDWFFVQHAMAVLSGKGTGVLHLPMGALFQGGKVQEIREVFVRNRHIHAVISLPEGAVPGTAILSTLIVVKEDTNDSGVLFVNGAAPQISNYFFRAKRGVTTISAEGISELTSIVRERKEIEGVSSIATLEEIAGKKYLLTPSAYTDASNEEKTHTEPVEDICTAISDLEQDLILNARKLAEAVLNFNSIINR